MKRAILAVLVMLVCAMPARAATLAISPTFSFLASGPCHPGLCTVFKSEIYDVAGGTEVLFGTATFFANIDLRGGPCPDNCLGVIGNAFARFSYVSGDLLDYTGSDFWAFPDTILCSPGGGGVAICDPKVVSLTYLLPDNAIGIQLIISGRFNIEPAFVTSEVPLPAALHLLAAGLLLLNGIGAMKKNRLVVLGGVVKRKKRC